MASYWDMSAYQETNEQAEHRARTFAAWIIAAANGDEPPTTHHQGTNQCPNT